jgi:hypothetical protein
MQWSNATAHDQQFISMSNDLNCFELILSYDRDILYISTSLSSDVTYTLSIFWVRIRCAQLLLPLFWVMRWAIGTSQVSKIIKVSRKTSNLRLWHQFWTKCGDSPPSSVQKTVNMMTFHRNCLRPTVILQSSPNGWCSRWKRFGGLWGGWGIQLRTEIAPNSLKQPPTIPNLSKL